MSKFRVKFAWLPTLSNITNPMNCALQYNLNNSHDYVRMTLIRPRSTNPITAPPTTASLIAQGMADDAYT